MSKPIRFGTDTPVRIEPDMQRPHISKHAPRGYVEYDPIVRLSDGTKLEGLHGLMDIRAEVGRSAYLAGMLDTQVIKDILKKP